MSWKPKKKRRRPPPQRRLLVESLETRSLLSAVPITELIQGVHITPTASSVPTLTSVSETESIGSTLYILGQLNDEAAYQAVTLGAAPVINAPVTLPSLVSYLDPSTAVISAGQLRGVAAGTNGEVEFYGWSLSPNATPGLGHDQPEATMWDTAGVPTALGFVDQSVRQSYVTTVSDTGIFAGIDSMTAFVGKAGANSVALPNNSPGWIDAVLATTPDGSILVGSDGELPGAWEGNPADLTSYHELTSAYSPATDGSIPDMFWFTTT
ncbi:MAG: hypothetical protein NTY19_41445, partial [Planctomycetota bacterium]|nr:hypothetical protein [Planctomycetota bacterium]